MAEINCAHDEVAPLNKLVRNPRNPNTHPEEQIRLLAKIIDYQGWRNPIVVSNRSGFIIKGHARLDAAEVLGLTEAPVDYQDYENEAQEWADMLADNRIAELAETDKPVLKDILGELDTGEIDMEMTGYTEADIEDLMTEYNVPGEGLTDDDAVPEPTESISRRGDLWSLGNHRLLCGDATLKADVEKLMGGEKVDMVFTDPPYGIDIDTSWLTKINLKHKSKPNKSDAKIVNDDGNLDLSAIFNYPKWFIWGFPYIANPNMTGWLVWDKWPDQRGSLDAKLGNPCELALTNIWNGFRLVRLLWRGYFRASGEERLSHPTQKPLGVIEPIIATVNGNIVDPFGGSGSTLIACEKLGRRCFMMEIDEHYCDVIIERWQQYTGNKAVRIDA